MPIINTIQLTISSNYILIANNLEYPQDKNIPF